MVTSKTDLTLEEFLKLPEEKPALEYFRGEVTQKALPKLHHSRIQTFLTSQFNLCWEPLKLASAFTELRATYGGESTVPDISVYRWERIPIDETGRLVSDSFLPPDIAVEIVSPDQSVRMLIDRCRWYVENGVGAAILVNSDDESVRLFLPGLPPRQLDRGDRVDVEAVLPNFDLTVEDLFGALYYRR